MKTLAIALFASLALSACATEEQDIQPIDKVSEQRDLDQVADELRDRAGQVLVPEGVGIQPGGQHWAEELIIDGKQWSIVHGPKGVEAIIDDLGNEQHRLDLKRFPE